MVSVDYFLVVYACRLVRKVMKRAMNLHGADPNSDLLEMEMGYRGEKKSLE